MTARDGTCVIHTNSCQGMNHSSFLVLAGRQIESGECLKPLGGMADQNVACLGYELHGYLVRDGVHSLW